MKYFLTCLALGIAFAAGAQAPNSNWDPDWDGDGNVGISDLLGLLTLFGEFDLDSDGIWDSQDDCVGQYDECGICNGSGVPEGYCSCSEVLDAVGECGGDCLEDADGDGICDVLATGCIVDSILYHDYWYELVEIGDQCWFAENLRTAMFENGDEIPSGVPDIAWQNASVPYCAVYGDDEGCNASLAHVEACDPVISLEEYGRLYNGYVITDERNVCPSGWKVPSDEDWMILEVELGMSEGDANSSGWRGSQAFDLMATYSWIANSST